MVTIVLLVLLGLTVAVGIWGYARFSAPGNAQKAAFLSGGVLFGWTGALSIVFAASGEEEILNMMILISGAGVGLLIGALVSPWGTDAAGFTKLTTAIGAFLGGYLADKAKSLVEQILSKDFLFEPTHAFRFMAFFVAATAAGVATYAARVYGRVDGPRQVVSVRR